MYNLVVSWKKNMKKIIVTSLVLLSLLFAAAKTTLAIKSVRGYFKPSTYRYVAPYFRTSPNRYKIDNWSTKGNVNPFTGKKGYKSLY